MNNTYYKETLSDGTRRIYPIYALIAGSIAPTAWAKPRNGDTITVEYSFDGTETWEPTPIVVTTVNWNDAIVAGVTHVSFTRSAGTGSASTVGVC